jgi:hypothetical protein
MTKLCKIALVTLLLLSTVFFASACSKEATPYEENDAAGYTVSIRYDANGGFFATSTSVIMDSYNLAGMSAGSNGMVSLGLLAPEDSRRGSSDTFAATKNGYFLAGWYTERVETIDSQGNVTYTYGNQWDFSTDVVEVDPNKTYTSSEPVLTLYACWIPMFEINFISLGTDEVLGTYTFNPLTASDILIPQWDTETGAMEMYRFPEKKGYTFHGAYYDAEGKQAAIDVLKHTGTILPNGTAEGHSMNVYVDWMEGEWYHIYTAEQLRKNASTSGHYILEADLDFADQNWPGAFATGNFSGSIQGNGHTIKNVNFEQTKMDAENTGLFGTLQAGSKIEDVIFENVTFTVKKGFNRAANYGLLAGAIYDGAQLENVQIKSSQLLIDSGARFASEDYAIGLVCGAGKANLVIGAEISVAVTGKDPEKYTVTVDEDGNSVIVTAAG